MSALLLSFVLFVAIAAPLVLWVRARALVKHVGEPLFAERFWTYRRTAAFVVAFVSAFLIVIAYAGSSRDAAIGAIVCTSGLLLAWYDIRRKIFGETWSLGTFLRFRIGLIAAMSGFWLVVLVAPLSLPDLGRATWPLAICLAMGLLLWARWYPAVTSWLLQAKRIDDPVLTADMQRLVAKMSITAPTLYRADTAGGVFANAFALPSTRGGRVVLFSTLFDRLSHREIVAILAHELAHVEQFDRRVLRRHRIVTTGLILLGMFGFPLMSELIDSGLVATIVWLAIGLSCFSLLMRGAKHRETLSDARAAELTEDPESFISALTKLHAIAHLPKQWDAMTEQRCSHPGLTQRIAAIRRLEQTAGPAIETPVVVRGLDAGTYLLFEGTRLRYITGAEASNADDPAELLQRAEYLRTFPYDRLAGLSVEPDISGAAVVVREASGARTRIRVPEARVAEIGDLLDRVEIKVPDRRPDVAEPRTLRALALGIAILALLAGSPGAVIVPLLVALARPTAASAAALAAATVIGALYLPMAIDAVSVALAAGAAWWTWRRTKQTETQTYWQLGAAILGLWALASSLLVLVSGTEPVQLADAVGTMPAAVAAPVSFGVFLWMARRKARWAPLALLMTLAAGIAVALVGTTWFADRFSQDALMGTRRGAGGRAFAQAAVTLTPVGPPSRLDRYGDLRVSPGGTAYGVLEWCEGSGYEGCASRRISVGDARGVARTLMATDMRFLDDDTIVILEKAEESARLRAEPLAGGRELWAAALPRLGRAHLQVTPVTRQWTVVSNTEERHARFEGHVGVADIAPRVWRREESDESWVEWFSAQGPAALGLRPVYGGSRLQLWLWRWLPDEAMPDKTDLISWDAPSLEPIATSVLDVRCFEAEPAAREVTCLASAGRRTHVWRIDPSTRRLENVGWFHGRRPDLSSAFLGERFTIRPRDEWRMIDLRRGQDLLLHFPGERRPYTVAVTENGVAALTWFGENHSELAFYRLVER